MMRQDRMAKVTIVSLEKKIFLGQFVQTFCQLVFCDAL